LLFSIYIFCVISLYYYNLLLRRSATYNVTRNIQCYPQHTMLPATYNVTRNIQCYPQHTMLPATYNVTRNIQCYPQHTMLPATYNVTRNIQCYPQHTMLPVTYFFQTRTLGTARIVHLYFLLHYLYNRKVAQLILLKDNDAL